MCVRARMCGGGACVCVRLCTSVGDSVRGGVGVGVGGGGVCVCVCVRARGCVSAA